MCSFVLKRFDKVRNIVEPDLAQIHVTFDLVKNRSPDWHFARSMRCRRLFLPGDNRLDAVVRKLAAVSMRQQREIGRRMPECGSGRAVAFATRPMTGRAVLVEDLRAFKRKRNVPTRIPGRSLAADNEWQSGGNKEQYSSGRDLHRQLQSSALCAVSCRDETAESVTALADNGAQNRQKLVRRLALLNAGVRQRKLMARYAAITREHDNGGVGLQHAQRCHKPGIVSLAVAVKKDSIEVGLSRDLNRTGIVIRRYHATAIFAQDVRGFGKAAGEIVQVQNRWHTCLPAKATR